MYKIFMTCIIISKEVSNYKQYPFGFNTIRGNLALENYIGCYYYIPGYTYLPKSSIRHLISYSNKSGILYYIIYNVSAERCAYRINTYTIEDSWFAFVFHISKCLKEVFKDITLSIANNSPKYYRAT